MQHIIKTVISGLAISSIALGLYACQPQPYSVVVPMMFKKVPQEMDYLHSQGVDIVDLGQSIRLVFPSDRFFLGTSATLAPHKTQVLEQVAAFASHYPQAHIYITGYNDRVLTNHKAKKQSLAKAEAIAGFLWNDGLPTNHMTVRGKGYVAPLNNMQTPKASSENRRVEMVLTPIY
mgnify:CR=1 FL=1